MLKRIACAGLAAAALVAGCGGGDGSEDRETARAKAPAGIDVQAVNRARSSFVAACNRREAGGDAAEISAARRAASVMLEALEANPDEAFRPSPRAPAVTMRDRVRALALVARTKCGDRMAAKLGDRIARAAARKSS